MAYDEILARRVREVLRTEPHMTERRMFGGLAFLIGGHMCCGVVRDDLMVRVGAKRYEAALERAHVREMDFTGRPLRGMVFVSAGGLRTARALRGWITRALQAAAEEPPRSATTASSVARDSRRRGSKKSVRNLS
jgi:hypothetical protein